MWLVIEAVLNERGVIEAYRVFAHVHNMYSVMISHPYVLT